MACLVTQVLRKKKKMKGWGQRVLGKNHIDGLMEVGTKCESIYHGKQISHPNKLNVSISWHLSASDICHLNASTLAYEQNSNGVKNRGHIWPHRDVFSYTKVSVTTLLLNIQTSSQKEQCWACEMPPFLQETNQLCCGKLITLNHFALMCQ